MNIGTKVAYTYRQHYLLGGAIISGSGVIVAETVVGTDLGYVIRPADGSDCVHVRAAGVSEA